MGWFPYLCNIITYRSQADFASLFAWLGGEAVFCRV